MHKGTLSTRHRRLGFCSTCSLRILPHTKYLSHHLSFYWIRVNAADCKACPQLQVTGERVPVPQLSLSTRSRRWDIGCHRTCQPPVGATAQELCAPQHNSAGAPRDPKPWRQRLQPPYWEWASNTLRRGNCFSGNLAREGNRTEDPARPSDLFPLRLFKSCAHK